MYKYVVLCLGLSFLPIKSYAFQEKIVIAQNVERSFFKKLVSKGEKPKEQIQNVDLKEQEKIDKQENTYNAISKIGGSPSLLKGAGQNVNQYDLKKNGKKSERRLDNSKEKLQERLQKSKEDFEKREGLSIEEANKFYSDNLNQEKNKPLKLVKDPLDKQD
ncbi:MAG: hypothetical protein BWY78_00589 [Alphaproteobacteria bacterium ADurb.Bin438]|nr:MAG: hypothetical protein BWY78_00589 [Alphaproteobacteria bacterium ADurb.Bin438]